MIHVNSLLALFVPEKTVRLFPLSYIPSLLFLPCHLRVTYRSPSLPFPPALPALGLSPVPSPIILYVPLFPWARGQGVCLTSRMKRVTTFRRAALAIPAEEAGLSWRGGERFTCESMRGFFLFGFRFQVSGFKFQEEMYDGGCACY